MMNLRKSLAAVGFAVAVVATGPVSAHGLQQGGGQGMMGQGMWQQPYGSTAGPRQNRGGYGYGMHGYGMMGPQMMNPYMMGPQMVEPGTMGYGMTGPQMMGPGMMGYGMMGPGVGPVPLARDLSVDDVKHMLMHRLAWHGAAPLKLGDVEEKDADVIVAEIMNDDGQVVQRIEVDRHTGWMHAVPLN